MAEAGTVCTLAPLPVTVWLLSPRQSHPHGHLPGRAQREEALPEEVAEDPRPARHGHPHGTTHARPDHTP